MATRNLIMVVDRRHARGNKDGLAIQPDQVTGHSYVHMYHHHDGYPEWQAVQIANWLNVNNRQDGSAMASKLVHDMYYDSCYLYADVDNVDHQYTYVIWTGNSAKTMVACHDRYSEKCLFVLPADKIIEKYKTDMEYTDFKGGETRYIANYNKVRSHAKKIIDILTTD